MRLEAGANCCLSEARIARPRGLELLTNRVEVYWLFIKKNCKNGLLVICLH